MKSPILPEDRPENQVCLKAECYRCNVTVRLKLGCGTPQSEADAHEKCLAANDNEANIQELELMVIAREVHARKSSEAARRLRTLFEFAQQNARKTCDDQPPANCCDAIRRGLRARVKHSA